MQISRPEIRVVSLLKHQILGIHNFIRSSENFIRSIDRIFITREKNYLFLIISNINKFFVESLVSLPNRHSLKTIFHNILHALLDIRPNLFAT